MENNIEAITAGLDPVQLKAVTCMDGPVLIVAGAGAGKTRVLTSRIAYAVGRGTQPDRILALTFTKKAAGEMKERIADMVGERSARRLYMGTFHSVFIRLMREFSEKLGYPHDFTIYDTSDSLSAIKRCIKNLKLDEKLYKPKYVLSRISNAKNELWTPSSYKKDYKRVQDDIRSRIPAVCDIYSEYQNMMKQAGVMDYDDILMNMNILLKNEPEALRSISGRFDYILVDEYQDTNYSQYLILKKLSAEHRNICVVGDDSQSIYGFRGARIENILNFSRDYPEYKLFKLERNYRSTQVIVNAANSVISNNSNRIPKECYSSVTEGDKIKLVKAYTDKEEALLVVSSIINKMGRDHAQYQDFAILYRTNNQSRVLEEALRKRNLPYRIYSGNSFFDRAEIKDMMAYFKLVVNNQDNESFLRVYNSPARGIGETSIACLSSASKISGCSLFDAINLPNLADYGLKNAAVSKLKSFRELIAKASADIRKKDAYSVAVVLSDDCGLYRSFKMDNSIESQSRAANIEELLNNVKEFVEKRENDYREEILSETDVADVSQLDSFAVPNVGLGEFLEDISLLSAVDTVTGEEDADNKINLMTVHSAKGLEFPYVYVVGMEDGLFPSDTGGFFADVEEERRLFYVALTRAKSSLVLSFCCSRMKNGETKEFPVSRFIREIDPKYIENPLQADDSDETFEKGAQRDWLRKPRPSNFQSSANRQSSFRSGSSFSYDSNFRSSATSPSSTTNTAQSQSATFASRLAQLRSASAGTSSDDKEFAAVSVLSLRTGMRVEHNRFGVGTILEISGTASELKARIKFDAFGEKLLLLKYAKLRML